MYSTLMFDADEVEEANKVVQQFAPNTRTFRIFQVTSPHRGDDVAVEYLPEHETQEELLHRLRNIWPDTILNHVYTVVGDYHCAKAAAMWHLLELHRNVVLKQGRQWKTGINPHDLTDYLRTEVSTAQRLLLPFSNEVIRQIVANFHVRDQDNAKTKDRVMCERCGALSLRKFLIRHQNGDTCINHGEPKTKLTVRQLAVKKEKQRKAFNEAQKTKIRCYRCGKITSRRHLRRHQEGAPCMEDSYDTAENARAAYAAFVATQAQTANPIRAETEPEGYLLPIGGTSLPAPAMQAAPAPAMQPAPAPAIQAEAAPSILTEAAEVSKNADVLISDMEKFLEADASSATAPADLNSLVQESIADARKGLAAIRAAPDNQPQTALAILAEAAPATLQEQSESILQHDLVGPVTDMFARPHLA